MRRLCPRCQGESSSVPLYLPQPSSAHLLRGGSAAAHHASAPGLPRLDLLITRHGITCARCQTTSHFRCWGFTQVVEEDRWLCDGCHHLTEARSRAAIRCFVCNRSSLGGGPLFPFRSGDSSGAVGETWCHLVCALSVPELTVRYVSTVFHPDGRVNMTHRPFILPQGPSPTLKLSKQKYTQHCMYCNSVSPLCLRCGHPNCFETMHPACAATAHTLEFFPHSSCGMPTDLGEETAPKSTSSSTSTTGPSDQYNNVGLLLWSHCVPYCSQHYGALLNRSSLSSQALHEQAEKVALKLDLTGKLRREADEDYSKPSSPVCPVVKRGRGRPPFKFIQIRKEDQGMCDRIKTFWTEKRKVRHQVSARWVTEINDRKVRPIVCASLRPELIKVNLNKVRLSHFLSLVPEWQALLVIYVEGELPLPDLEYLNATGTHRSSRRVNAGSRRSTNGDELQTHMKKALQQMDTFHLICKTMHSEVAARDTQVNHELQLLENTIERQLQSLE